MSSKGATHPGAGSEAVSGLPSPTAKGGGGLDEAVTPDDLQLPLADVPEAQTERASYEDWDVAV